MRHTLRSWLAAASLAGLALVSGCGGGGGDPAPPPPATVGPPLVDTARASSASIGPAGGTVRATAADGVEYTLTVPARALTETVTIRMTPIVDLRNPALGSGLIGAVQFEPSGLRFERLATLRIGTVGVLPAGSRRVGFSSAGDGSRVQLSPPIVSNGGTEIPVAHFSSAGAANLTPGQIEQLPLEELTDLSDPNFWFDELMRLSDANFNPAGMAAVFTLWLDQFVNLEIAKASDTFESVLDADVAYEKWADGLKLAVFQVSPEAGAALQALLAPAQAQTQAALARAYLGFINSSLTPCPNTVLFLGEPSFFQKQAAAFGIDSVEFGLDRPSFLRKVNDCLRPVLDPATLPSPLRLGQAMSLDLRAQVVFNGRPDPVGVPFEFSITATDATVGTPVGFSDDGGRFTTVFTPSTTAPTFNVRACLITLEGTSDICVTQQVRAEANVFAGTVTVTSNFASGGQSSVTAFVRVRVDADNSSGEVIEASGSHSYNFPKEAFCVRADGSNFTVPLNDSGTGTVTAGTFSNVRGGELTLLGVLTRTQDGDRDLGAFCDIVTVITTTPANSPEQFVVLSDPIKVLEAGRLVSLNYARSDSQTGSTRTVTGILLLER
jgi:hypothetical protein